MDHRHVGQVALYTARPDAYSEVDVKIVSDDQPDVEKYLREKERVLDSSDVIVVDFKGFSKFEPQAFLMGALKRLASGMTYAVASIGIDEFAVEEILTNDAAEKEAVRKARQEARLRFLHDVGELTDWLGSLEKRP